MIVCEEPADAILAAERLLIDKDLGEAGARIIVEERLTGPEVSLLAIADGHTLFMLEPAQDHKRLLDEDKGPNTGGMGAFCPSPTVDEVLMQQIERQIFVPILDALVREGIHYRGVLYAGLILTAGGPKVLEFNCRFGDPEAQAVLLRLRSDLLELIDAAVSGRLEQADVRWDPRNALCVVLASGGYPEQYPTGLVINGLPNNANRDDLMVFHAGTKRVDDRIVTAGGRVLGVTALGDTLAEARQKAYEIVEQITFEGVVYRRDLGA